MLMKKAKVIKRLNNQISRDIWVREKLQQQPYGNRILDVGSGSQRYRDNCYHLEYFAHDFKEFSFDSKKSFTGDNGGDDGYQYGDMDYCSDILDIPVENESFDIILCTEVFEHIPRPIEALREVNRILRRDGLLVLTAPTNSLRHFDPFYFYSGFSDNWYKQILKDEGFKIIELTQIGDYYSWMSVELLRTMRTHNLISSIILFPAFLYYFFKKTNEKSKNTLSEGYLVLAQRT